MKDPLDRLSKSLEDPATRSTRGSRPGMCCVPKDLRNLTVPECHPKGTRYTVALSRVFLPNRVGDGRPQPWVSG